LIHSMKRSMTGRQRFAVGPFKPPLIRGWLQ